MTSCAFKVTCAALTQGTCSASGFPSLQSRVCAFSPFETLRRPRHGPGTGPARARHGPEQPATITSAPQPTAQSVAAACRCFDRPPCLAIAHTRTRGLESPPSQRSESRLPGWWWYATHGALSTKCAAVSTWKLHRLKAVCDKLIFCFRSHCSSFLAKPNPSASEVRVHHGSLRLTATSFHRQNCRMRPGLHTLHHLPSLLLWLSLTVKRVAHEQGTATRNNQLEPPKNCSFLRLSK